MSIFWKYTSRMRIRKKWLKQLINFFNKHFKEYYLASFRWWIPSSCENHCNLLCSVQVTSTSKFLPSHLSIGSSSSETSRTTRLPVQELSVLYLQLISVICVCFWIYSEPITKVEWLKNAHAVHYDYCIICKKRGTSTDTFLKSRKLSKDNESLLVPFWKYT